MIFIIVFSCFATNIATTNTIWRFGSKQRPPQTRSIGFRFCRESKECQDSRGKRSSHQVIVVCQTSLITTSPKQLYSWIHALELSFIRESISHEVYSRNGTSTTARYICCVLLYSFKKSAGDDDIPMNPNRDDFHPLGNFCFFLYAFSMKALKASDPNHSPNSGESIEGTPPDGADDGAATTFSGSFLLMALFILKSMYNPVYPPMMAMATKRT